ncbi:hypothetical protein SDC9_163312 [bioreactor metagenome]|uniref:Uncharacterized protein n=1 Tax=bioreactor metagenome TaxID=1076179 RepID=A0A645FQJ2_9ZZZZ
MTASGPEPVPIDKEIPVYRIIPFFQDIPELRGLNGGVIDHKIKNQLYAAFSDAREILPGGQGFIEPVINNRKAPVQIRMEQAWQDV